MKLSVKFNGQLATMDVDTLDQLILNVAKQFHLDKGKFGLLFGGELLLGDSDRPLGQMGLVSGDRLFVSCTSGFVSSASGMLELKEKIDDKRTDPINVNTPDGSLNDHPSTLASDDPFLGIVWDTLQRLCLPHRIQVIIAEDNVYGQVDNYSIDGDLFRFNCSHPRSSLIAQVIGTIWERGARACVSLTGSVRLPGGSRLFTSTVHLESRDAKSTEHSIGNVFIPSIRRLMLGSEEPLSNLLTIGSVGEKVLSQLDVSSLLCLERVNSFLCDFCRSENVDRCVWKALLRRDYPGESSSSDGLSYRQQYERCLRDRKQRLRDLQFPPMFVDPLAVPTRPFRPFVPTPLNPPLFPWHQPPPDPLNPLFPFGGEIMPSRPMRPNFGQPRRFGSPFDPFL